MRTKNVYGIIKMITSYSDSLLELTVEYDEPISLIKTNALTYREHRGEKPVRLDMSSELFQQWFQGESVERINELFNVLDLPRINIV